MNSFGNILLSRLEIRRRSKQCKSLNVNLETRNIFKRGGDGAPRDDVGVQRERRITKRRSSDNQQSTERVNIEQSASGKADICSL